MIPFFSVIIPTLNEEKYLPRLLKNLQSQKEKDFEIIVADANSEDGTREIALKYNSLSIRVFNNQRKNVAYQRNIGAEKARGTYLVFLDADAGISPTFFSRLHTYIEKKKGLLFLPSVKPYERMGQAEIIFPLVNFFLEASQNFGSPFSTGGSIIVEKNFFHLIGGFNEKLFISEDHDLVQNAYSWGVKAKFLRNITFRFSLRRMKKEGQLSLFYKYLVATAHVLLRRQMKKKVFEYEMGGQFYKQHDKKQDMNILIKDYILQIKRFFSQVLSEE
jgi:glycosyltransferase involved in cell wall biosynthesis